jgi:hypothetical protein
LVHTSNLDSTGISQLKDLMAKQESTFEELAKQQKKADLAKKPDRPK